MLPHGGLTRGARSLPPALPPFEAELAMEIGCLSAALAWAFAGSLLLGLGTRPVAAWIAWAWLAGEVLIGLVALAWPRARRDGAG